MKTLTDMYINQDKAIEWQLNLECASIYGFLASLEFWAGNVYCEDTNKDWYGISAYEVVKSLPLLNISISSVYDYFDYLEFLGIMEYSEIDGEGVILLNKEKLDEWHS